MSRQDIPRIGRKRPLRLFITEWMKAKGLTQMDIANRLDINSTGTISKKLAKPEKMSVEWLAAFAYALDVDVEQLYYHPDRPRPEDILKGIDEPTRVVVLRMIQAAKRA